MNGWERFGRVVAALLIQAVGSFPLTAMLVFLSPQDLRRHGIWGTIVVFGIILFFVGMSAITAYLLSGTKW